MWNKMVAERPDGCCNMRPSQIIPDYILTQDRRKTIFTFLLPVTLTFALLSTSNFPPCKLLVSTSPPNLKFLRLFLILWMVGTGQMDGQGATFYVFFLATDWTSSMRRLSPIHTADADATQLSAVCIEFATSWRQSRRVSTSLNNLPTTKSSCVVSAVWTHESSVVTQFPIFCASHI